MQVLVLEVSGLGFAIPTSSVVEVIPAIPSRPVPGSPGAVNGVVTWRGRVLPVLDLARHLGRGDCPVWLSRRIVVCDLTGRPGRGAPTAFETGPGDPLLGILVEAAGRVAAVDDALLVTPPEPLPPGLPGLGRLLRHPTGLLQLVDVADLVPPDVLEAILGGAGVP